MSKKSKSQVQTNDSSSLSIGQLAEMTVDNTLAQLRSDLAKEQDKFNKMSEVVDNLVRQLEEKEEEISQLKHILSNTTPVAGEITVSPITDEELIADIQLRKLLSNAKIRELTLDETRKFDLLVKNKRLATGQATNIDKDELPKELSGKSLLQIAYGKKEGK